MRVSLAVLDYQPVMAVRGEWWVHFIPASAPNFSIRFDKREYAASAVHAAGYESACTQRAGDQWAKEQEVTPDGTPDAQ